MQVRMYGKEKPNGWETQRKQKGGETHKKSDTDSEKGKREGGRHTGIKNLHRTEISLNEHNPSGQGCNPARKSQSRL